MGQFIFGVRGGIHIIDLTKTVDLLDSAAAIVKNVTEQGGKVLFVGTKRQARSIVAGEAGAAGMPYICERWLGGMLTNFRTIRSRINRLKEIEEGFESGDYEAKFNKKEQLRLKAEQDKLARIFNGIKNMDEMPRIVFVVDTAREDIAIAEANNLKIPVIAIADSNTNPDRIDYPIPANDDSIKSIKLITSTIAEAAAEGAKVYAKTAKEQADAEAAKAAEEPAKAAAK